MCHFDYHCACILRGTLFLMSGWTRAFFTALYFILFKETVSHSYGRMNG